MTVEVPGTAVIAADPSTRNPISSAPTVPRGIGRGAPVATSKLTSSVGAHAAVPQLDGTMPEDHQISLVPGRHSAAAPSNAMSERFSGSASGHHASESGELVRSRM